MNFPRRALSSTFPLLPALTIALLLAATLVGYYGTRTGSGAAVSSVPLDQADAGLSADAWPNEEPEAPAGPNREHFQSSCVICHSTRLVFTQPRFPEKKWKEIVHKMVDVYGAPLSAAEEEKVTAYLTAIKGR